MYYFKTKTLTDAWIKACKYLCDHGKRCSNANIVRREILNLYITIENGNELDHKLYFKYFNKKVYEEVISIYELSGRKFHGYNYGKRILDYHNINQIKKIEKILRNDPFSRSASILLADPQQDKMHIPCIMNINFKVRDEKLLMTLVFKSCDIAKKFIPDIFSLSKIHALLSQKLQIARGSVHIFIMSAQIYKEDIQVVQKLINNTGKIAYFNQQKIITNWNKEAGQWDNNISKPSHYVNIENGYHRFLNFTKKIMKNNHISQDDFCLDLGSGTGILARLLKKYSDNVFGVDIANEMIIEARKKIKNVKFILANCLDLPFPDNYFKLIASRGILISHVGKKYFHQFIKEVHRVLRKNGYFIFDFLANVKKEEIKLKRNKAIFNKIKITHILQQNGFRVVDFDGKDDYRINSVFCIKK